VRFSIENNSILHLTSADTYYGPDFFKKGIERLEFGYDAIINQPMRIAYESSASLLSLPNISVNSLFDIGFTNLHSLWTSSNWDNPYFTKIPFQMIWSDERSICLRGFSLSPFFLVPQEWMIGKGGSTDISLLPHLKNPCFVSYWSDLPALELISISEWYPVFRNKKSNIQDVVIWAKNNIVLENYNNLLKYIIYKKSNDPINQELISKSKLITDEIMNAIKFL